MRVLLVDDDAVFLRFLGKKVTEWGHQATLTSRGMGAIEALEKIQFDAIVTDVRMPGISGWGLLQHLDRRDVSCPCLLHSSDIYFNDGHIVIDNLKCVTKYFEFAQFHLKSDDFTYIKQFLDGIKK